MLNLALAKVALNMDASAEALLSNMLKAHPPTDRMFDVWAEVNRETGNTKAAEELTEKALTVQNRYEDDAEVAALYFRLAWQNGQLALQSPLATIMTAPDTAQKAAPTAPETAKKAEPPVPDP